MLRLLRTPRWRQQTRRILSQPQQICLHTRVTRTAPPGGPASAHTGPSPQELGAVRGRGRDQGHPDEAGQHRPASGAFPTRTGGQHRPTCWCSLAAGAHRCSTAESLPLPRAATAAPQWAPGQGDGRRWPPRASSGTERRMCSRSRWNTLCRKEGSCHPAGSCPRPTLHRVLGKQRPRVSGTHPSPPWRGHDQGQRRPGLPPLDARAWPIGDASATCHPQGSGCRAKGAPPVCTRPTSSSRTEKGHLRSPRGKQTPAVSPVCQEQARGHTSGPPATLDLPVGQEMDRHTCSRTRTSTRTRIRTCPAANFKGKDAENLSHQNKRYFNTIF